MTENSWETDNVWQWLENDEIYYKIFQLFLCDPNDKKVARLLKDFIAEQLLYFGKFGDLTSTKQLEKVDWMQIVQANRD
jgi:hypothetical protein